MAFERGGRDPRMLWDFGRLVQSRHGDVAIRAFSELLKQEPARVDVRLELADAQLRFGSPADALTTLVGIRAVTPSDAPRYFRIAIYAHLQHGDLKDAEETAIHYRDVAKTDADRAAAELLMAEVARQTAKPSPAGAAATWLRADSAASPEVSLLHRAKPTATGSLWNSIAVPSSPIWWSRPMAVARAFLSTIRDEF